MSNETKCNLITIDHINLIGEMECSSVATAAQHKAKYNGTYGGTEMKWILENGKMWNALRKSIFEWMNDSDVMMMTL